MPFASRYRQLPSECYSEVSPTPLENPFLIAWNQPLAEAMEIDSVLNQSNASDHLGAMAPLKGTTPIAAVYGGHQFGHYVPQLGDGRSILLGEWQSPHGHWDLHLKGSGKTPYSRMGDGRAVLRSTIREFLCSEAMHHLGIPTTRALGMIGSEEEVHREQLEYGATLLRIAPSHIRFGTFEYFYYRSEEAPLQQLLSHLVEHHYPTLQGVPAEQQALTLFKAITTKTAALIAQWQLVGFSHGVMNSDNMSMLGLTIDYGPYGFMERYDPSFICNHSDHTGRYAFDQQPAIGEWNLRCLAQALLPLVGDTPEEGAEQLREVLAGYQQQFDHAYQAGLASKLGLSYQAEDEPLYQAWLDLLQQQQLDYTSAFRALSEERYDDLYAMVDDKKGIDQWMARYLPQLSTVWETPSQRSVAMKLVNPKYILRNHLAQTAIEQAEAGEYGEIKQLWQLLQTPYDEHPSLEQYATPPPKWAPSVPVSCSS